MILVGVMTAILWGVGAAMGAPKRARLTMIGVLFCGVLIVQVVLPDGHPLREATGGSPALWLLLLGFVAVGWGYGKVLGRVRGRAERVQSDNDRSTSDAVDASALKGGFSPGELDRYARHIVLREIGGRGQVALADARVLVVGAGGLGAPAILYLAAAGVGTIGVIDPDTVELGNLQRQIIHAQDRVGQQKAYSATEAVAALNSGVEMRPYARALTAEIAPDLFADYDVILDGTDSYAARSMINRAAVAASVPVVGGALTQWEGQLSVWDPARDGPCFNCVFPNAPDPALVPSCAEAGVLGPLPGVIGTMMAVEAVKLITGAGTPLRGRLHLYDALDGATRTIKVARREGCEVCG